MRPSVIQSGTRTCTSINPHPGRTGAAAGPTGGIFIVAKNLPEAIKRQIFDDPAYAEGKPSSFLRMLALPLNVIDIERQ